MHFSIPTLPRSVLAALATAAVLATAPGCMSRCASDLDCVKDCQCPDGTVCQLGLSCVNTFCELEESPLTCQVPEDFCKKYKDKGLCGSKKCDRTEDCTKNCNCVTRFTPMGGNSVDCCFDCVQQFSCDRGEGLCDSAYAGTKCDDICGGAIPQDDQCNPPPDNNGLRCKRVSCAGFLPGQTSN